MVREKILHQTRAGIIGGETAARQRCRTARTYVLAQTLRCPAYDPAPPSLLSLIPGMQARHRVVERIVNRLEWGELLRASRVGNRPQTSTFHPTRQANWVTECPSQRMV